MKKRHIRYTPTRVLAVLVNAGDRQVTTAEIVSTVDPDDIDGGRPERVFAAVRQLRDLGFDIRSERRYVTPPARDMRRLSRPGQIRIAHAIAAGHDELHSLAAHLGMSSPAVVTALTHMRDAGYDVGLRIGYRLKWASVDGDPWTTVSLEKLAA